MRRVCTVVYIVVCASLSTACTVISYVDSRVATVTTAIAVTAIGCRTVTIRQWRRIRREQRRRRQHRQQRQQQQQSLTHSLTTETEQDVSSERGIEPAMFSPSPPVWTAKAVCVGVGGEGGLSVALSYLSPCDLSLSPLPPLFSPSPLSPLPPPLPPLPFSIAALCHHTVLWYLL